MRPALVSLLVVAVLAAAPAAAAGQDDAARAAGDLPGALFEPAPDGVPGRAAPDDGGTPLLLAALLVALAAGAGYLTGSSRSTVRS
jgi:hypothetical protein